MHVISNYFVYFYSATAKLFVGQQEEYLLHLKPSRFSSVHGKNDCGGNCMLWQCLIELCYLCTLMFSRYYNR